MSTVSVFTALAVSEIFIFRLITFWIPLFTAPFRRFLALIIGISKAYIYSREISLAIFRASDRLRPTWNSLNMEIHPNWLFSELRRFKHAESQLSHSSSNFTLFQCCSNPNIPPKIDKIWTPRENLKKWPWTVIVNKCVWMSNEINIYHKNTQMTESWFLLWEKEKSMN